METKIEVETCAQSPVSNQADFLNGGLLYLAIKYLIVYVAYFVSWHMGFREPSVQSPDKRKIILTSRSGNRDEKVTKINT